VNHWLKTYLALLLFLFFHFLVKQNVSAQLKPLNGKQPEDVILIYRQIFCSLVDGEPVIFWWQGKVYSRIPGEKDRHLFNVEGMNIRTCGTVTNDQGIKGYRLVSREVMLYLDPETNQILQTWFNPFLNKEVAVFPVANDPVNTKPRFADQIKFTGIVQNEVLMFNFVIPLFYQNPLGGNYQNYIGGNYHALEMFNYFIPVAQLMDSKKNFVEQVNVSWTRISQWLPWMEMGDRQGILIFSAVGTRLNSWDDLPLQFKQEIETNYPLFLSPPPLDDQRPNQTSWTNFREYIDLQPPNFSP
jgi:hypothetical protein